MYPKGEGEPMNYDGERDLDGFKKWLSENAASLKVKEEVKEDL